MNENYMFLCPECNKIWAGKYTRMSAEKGGGRNCRKHTVKCKVVVFTSALSMNKDKYKIVESLLTQEYGISYIDLNTITPEKLLVLKDIYV